MGASWKGYDAPMPGTRLFRLRVGGLSNSLLFRVDFYMSHHEAGHATTDENVYAVEGRWR